MSKYWIPKLKFLILLIVIFSSCTKEKTNEGPNIILFIADDVSSDDIGAYGNSAVSTPFIDSLATTGIRFTNAFLTTSSCSPSRASIISGRYPHNTGAPELHMPLPVDINTIAGQLKNSGYFSGASGKWHLGDSIKKDFDVVLDKEIGVGGEDRWLELIDELPTNKPYFLWMASIDAHRNWGENEFSGSSDMSKANLPPYVVNDSLTRNDYQQYYDEISRFDFQIGQSLKRLAERGMLENTLIFVLADNGRPFPRDKTRMYDSGLQTPLIISDTNGLFPQGVKSNALVSVVDLAPTISILCNLEPLVSYQGIDFYKVLNNPERRHRNYIFGEHNWHDYQAHERMVRSEHYMYIENSIPEMPMSSAADVHSGDAFKSLVEDFQEGVLDDIQRIHFVKPRPNYELYNVRKDPYQLVNLANNYEYSHIRYALKQKLIEWSNLTGDTRPENLTASRYDFFTARDLLADRSFLDIDRGEISGASKNAKKIISKDITLQ